MAGDEISEYPRKGTFVCPDLGCVHEYWETAPDEFEPYTGQDAE
jgi:hypothetical protein